MQYVTEWDWATLVFYILLALFCSLLLKKSIKYKKSPKYFKIFNYELNYKFVYYALVIVLLVFIMCTRVIEGEIGGADSLRYNYFFETFNYVPFSLKNILSMHGWEYVFFNAMFLVKILGGNYMIFSIFVYTIIVSCYVYYFDKNIDDESKWFVSLLFILPYLKSMNIVRNSLAAAISLIGIESIKTNNKKMFIITFVVAYLTHYISVVLLFFGLFCFLVPENWYFSKKRCIVIALGTFCLTVIGIPIIKWLLSLTRYAGYLNRIEFSPFGYILYSMVYFVILFVFKDFIKELKKNNHIIYYKMIVFLSIVVPPFTVVNGTQRLLLYFEIPRFIMYGDLYKVLETKISNKYKKIFRYCFISFVILWIIFRIWRMYDSSGIMPYRNIIFE